MMKLIMMSLMLFVVSACTPWPKEGTGGYADITDVPFDEYSYYRDLNHIDVLQLRLLAARDNLDYLDLNGAIECFPDYFYQAEQLADKVTQQLAAEYWRDAEDDLIILERKYINSMRNRFDYINGKLYCQPMERSYQFIDAMGL